MKEKLFGVDRPGDQRLRGYIWLLAGSPGGTGHHTVCVYALISFPLPVNPRFSHGDYNHFPKPLLQTPRFCFTVEINLQCEFQRGQTIAAAFLHWSLPRGNKLFLGFTVSGSLSHAPGGCKHRSNQPSPHVFFFPCGGKWEFNLKCLSRQYICFFSVKTYWHCGQAACICWLARSLTSPACIDHTPLWAGPCRGAGKTAESKLHLPGVVQPTCMVWLLTASVFLGVHLRPLQLSCQYLRCQRQHIFFWGLYFILWDRWVPTRTLFNHSSSSYSSFLTLRAADLALVDSGTFLSVPCREG